MKTNHADGLSRADRRALWSVGVQFFVNGAATASFLARLPEIRDRLGVTVSSFGVLLALVGLFGLASSAFAGRIIHRFGTRRVLTVGGIAMVATLPLIGLATAPILYVAAAGAYVVGDALVDITMNLQASWISARRRVPVMNRLHGLWSIGTVTGGLVAGQAASRLVALPVHLALTAGAVGGLLVVVASGLLRHDEDEHADAAQRRVNTPARSHKTVYALLALGAALSVVVEQVGMDWATFRLADDFGVSAGTATLGFVAFTGGMTFGRLGGDQVQAWIGSDRLQALSVALAAGGIVLATLIPARPLAIAGFLLAGTGVATFMPHLYDEAARAPGRRGMGMGLMTGGMRLGVLIEPLLVGAVAGVFTDVGAAIAAVALPAVIAYAVVVRMAPARG